MPGPKIPNPRSDKAPSTWDMAAAKSGSWPWRDWVNDANSVEPMPMITARTITLMPDATTLPSTRSARNAVLFHRAKGTRTKPASVVSLNSKTVMKSWMERMKKAISTRNQESSSTKMVRALPKISGKPTRRLTCSSSGQAASKPMAAMRPG
jgi:hypothetical protein